MRWSLKELYSGFDSEEYQNDLVHLKESIRKFNLWSDENLSNLENPKTKLESYIEYTKEISKVLTKLMTFASLTSSVDANNVDALKYLDQLSVLSTELTKPQVSFQKYIKKLDCLEDIITSSEILIEHKFYLEEIKRSAQYMLSEEEEVLISKMRNTGSRAWTSLQNKVVSNLLVDIELNGEKKSLPLPMVRNLAYHKDANVRKTAYEAELNAYKKIEESSAAALNGIKGEVITLADLRDYTPLEEVLIQSRMDKKTLDSMFSAIKEFLPVFRKYYRQKGKILGHENGLPFYDMFAPVGDVDINFTYEEAMKFVVDNFRTFSDKLADFAQNAYENNWLDVEPREGKRGGAFCSNIHPIGESRIMANFEGSFSNMTTLAHELGHGYHGLNLRDESILNSRYPMPIAETASIFCETIVENAQLEKSSDEEVLGILEASISGAGQVIVDIYSRYVFETKLFEVRKDHSLSVEELKSIMIEAQKEAYGDGLDHKCLHPYMWINKTHYYSAGRNFYNFPYAFGLLFAKGIYAEYLNRGKDFVPEYDKLLNATGKNNIKDVAAMVGIDVSNPEFFRQSLKLIEKDIEKFIEISNK
ncbi:MAG: M3 family oligoendopeptidase [Tissierellaceae bacterium]|nr:M3 family oligoendopeptidase [Tissierellaceae bacterium]